MSIEKLQQDILYCQKTVRNLILRHYDQDRYMDIVDVIFKDIFQDYLKESGTIRGLHAENQCPDKLERSTKNFDTMDEALVRKANDGHV